MDEQGAHNRSWKRLKVFTGLVVVAFAVTLAVIIGNRLSNESLAVLAGAVCGVGAAIPTSLLVIAVARWRDGPRDFDGLNRAVQPTMPQRAYPPVVVVTPPGGQQRPDGWSTLPPSLGVPMQRHFTVVGGTSEDEETMPYG